MRYIILIFLIFPEVCFSSEVNFDDWAFNKDETSSITYTTNSSGSTLAYVCMFSSKQCIFYYSSETSCDDKQKSNILISSSIGSFSAETMCQRREKTEPYLSIINGDYSLFLDAVTKGDIIGIAMPLENGQFRVIRFSLKGARQAISYTEKNLSDFKKD